MAPCLSRQLSEPFRHHPTYNPVNIHRTFPQTNSVRVVFLVKSGFDEFFGEEDGVVIDAVELFKDVSTDLGVEVNRFDCGGSVGYAC